MSVVHFGFILGNLYISDNSTELKKAKLRKLYKLRPLLNRLQETFWKLEVNISRFDESMIKFKGRSSLKQYMPAKQ